MTVDRTKVLETAQKYLAKGNYERAIAEYQKLVKADPDDVRTWLKIGDLFTRKGGHEDACTAYMRVAEYYASQGFFLKAVAVFKQILKLDDARLDISLRLAEMYEELQLISDALSTYEHIAHVYATQGNVEGSLETLHRMVQLDPENIPVRIKYAEALSKAGHTEEAANAFEAGAELLRSQRRIDDYLKVAERLLFHRPTAFDTARELATIYLERGDAKRALGKLQVCFKADPTSVPTLELLAGAFHLLGQVPKTISVYREMARLHHDAGRFDERAAVLEKILELDPDDTDARQALAAHAQRSPARPIAAPPPSAVIEATDPATGEHSAPPARSLDEDNDIYILEDDDDVIAPARVEGQPWPDVDGSPELSPEEEWDTGSVPPEIAREARIARLLTECDVFERYGLTHKVREQLTRVLALDPNHIVANERIVSFYVENNEIAPAVARLLTLATNLELQDPDRAAHYLNRILELDPHNQIAQERLGRAPETASDQSTSDVLFLDEDDDELEIIELDEAELIELDEEEEHEIPTNLLEMSEPVLDPPVGSDIPALGSYAELTDQLDITSLPDHDVVSPEFPDPLHYDGSPIPPVAPEEFSAPPPHEPTPEQRAEFEERTASGSFEIEELLDEADFFLSQGLYDEARATVQEALGTYQQHPLLQDKLSEIEVAAVQSSSPSTFGPDSGSDQVFAFAERLAEEFDAVEGTPGGSDVIDVETVFAQFKKGVAEQISADDSDTHFDLGIAYKEMGLIDDAIQEFKIAMNNPLRECNAHTMIGLCLLEQRKLADAISHFKKGLYAEHKTEHEELGLYYELGRAYEHLNDPREALYYYQKVMKRAPKFRDISTRVRTLSQDALDNPHAPTPGPDDVDRAFDDLINEGD